MSVFIDIIGWASAVALLGSYLMVSIGRWSGTSPVFQWINLAGAAGFVVNTAWHGALPSAVLNIAWAVIGIVTLWRLSRARIAT